MATVRVWFGDDHCGRVSTLLPDRLGRVAASLPPRCGLDAETLCRNHTTFPYFAGFMAPELLEAVRRRMVDGRRQEDGGSRTFSNMKVSQLRFCPECARTDAAHLGAATWRRFHQTAGTVVCPIHGVPLIQAGGAGRSKDVSFRLPATSLSGAALIAPATKKAAQALAALDLALFSPRPPFEEAIARDRVKRLLHSAGFVDMAGHVDLVRLRASLRAFHGDAFLRSVGMGFDIESGNDWLSRTVRRSEAISRHPLCYTLLLALADAGWEDFELPLPRQDTAPPPWTASRGKETEEASLARCKRDLSALLAADPVPGLKQLREVAASAMLFVRSRDPDWYRANMPGRTRRYRAAGWAERDIETALRVAAVADAEITRPGRPRKITVALLANAISLKPALLLVTKARLPRTRQAALDLAETRLQFRFRQFEWARRQVAESGSQLSWHVFRRLAAATARLSKEEEAVGKKIFGTLVKRE